MSFLGSTAELENEVLGFDDSGADGCLKRGIMGVVLEAFSSSRHAEGTDGACGALQSMGGGSDCHRFRTGNVCERAAGLPCKHLEHFVFERLVSHGLVGKMDEIDRA
jgi:hypothetical protein